MKPHNLYFFPIFLLLFHLSSFFFLLPAQTIPVGAPLLENFLRRQQLLGTTDSTLSFCIRPIFPVQALKTSNPFDPDSSLFHQRKTSLEGIVRFDKNRGLIQLLPVMAHFQYTTHHPYSLNDGAMIPAKGFQMLTSAGIYAKYGPLSVQFNPDFVYARNDSFPGFPEAHSDAVWKAWYSTYNGIDLPERFGNTPWQKASWGQSSVRLTVGPVSLGLSNENLWWGPGMRNSLLMTNTAPGFQHITFNTTKPVRTPIGSFEWQLVAGRLDSSGFSLPVLERNGIGAGYIKAKRNDWRYFNGIVLSYNPRWVPGLFLGATRSFLVYRGDMGTRLNDYLPVIIPMSKKSLGGEEEENEKDRDQLASIFARWVWFKANAEIYFEFGREDHAWDLRDIYLQPEQSRAYVLGLRKLLPLKKKPGQFIEINLETTQLENTFKGGNRSQGSWYTHSQITHGYTHNGQILGAGIGPGSNMQTVGVNWIKGMKKIGLQLERYTHNNEFQYAVIKDIRSNWVDLSTSVVAEWDFRNFLIRAKIDEIISFNYQHLFVPLDPATTEFWTPAKNVFNLQVQVGVGYRW
jgi:hypothetical protein